MVSCERRVRLGDDKILLLLEHQLGIHRTRFARYLAVGTESSKLMGADPPRDRFFWLLTVDYGMAQAQAQINWLERVIGQIGRKDYSLPAFEQEDKS
jgi:hypothetical protein